MLVDPGNINGTMHTLLHEILHGSIVSVWACHILSFGWPFFLFVCCIVFGDRLPDPQWNGLWPCMHISEDLLTC